MSISIKGSFISIRYKKQEIERKINKAYCKQGDAKNNSVLAMARLIIFPKVGEIKINRKKQYGGDIKFNLYEELENSFESGELHAADLKDAFAKYLEKIIAPLRKGWN